MKTELNAREKIVLAKYNLARQLPFFGHLAYFLTPIEAREIKIVTGINVTGQQKIEHGAVDGKSLYYNPDWINTLTVEETAFWIVHSVLHCVLEHLDPSRATTRDKDKWHRACDLVANSIAQKQNSKLLRIPEGTEYNPLYHGWAVERVYGVLGDSKEQPKFDIHLPFAGDEEGGDLEWRSRVIQAYNHAIQQGYEPAGMSEIVNKILKPKVPWQNVLRRFVDSISRDDYSFMRPNRKTAYLGVYLPSFQSPSLGDIVVAFDTSGSISTTDLEQFLSELNAIYGSFSMRLHIMHCDAVVQKYTVLEPQEYLSVDDFEFVGRGGTSFVPIFEKIESEMISPSALIYLTDGYGTFPEKEPGYPVLWVSNNENSQYPFGEVTCIETGSR